MALRKEQAVFAGTVLVLGWLAWSSYGADGRRAAGARRADALVLERHPAPDLELVAPAARRTAIGDARELFSPPSDTRPLPPLEFVTPPLVPLAVLRPPPEPGPAPRLYGKLLRAASVSYEVPELFAAEEPVEADATPAGDARANRELSQEERAERITGYKKLYDWLRIVELKFGQIQNQDRFGLARRPAEDILFVEFNPQTGQPRLHGQGAIPIARASVTEFGFADTPPNRIELRRAEFGDPLSATEYEAALSFANACIDQRLATPRALEVAEEMFRRAMPVLAQDPAPRLGLARCYEAGFQLEKAFEEYQAMLAGAQERNPLVLVRLAELEARLRLTTRAEERLREAERYGRAQWQVQAGLGRFLLEHRREEEATVHLRLANQYEPAGPEAKRERARLRVDLGRALLATGDVPGAAEWFDKARQADPAEPRAFAGLLSIAALGPATQSLDGSGPAVLKASAEAASVAAEGETAGFDVLVAGSIAAIQRGTPDSLKRARAHLSLAAAVDPLRAVVPWRTISWLAEVCGYPEEALRYVELAYENDPSDPWTLYQRGRVLAARDDQDGAIESLRRALDRELDLVDALALIGELSYRRGDHASAERYLERAVMLDPKLVEAIVLRGINFLELGDLGAAEESFRAALVLSPDQPAARNALAWCFYRKGDPVEAQTRWRDLDENRRAFPENDPHRQYALAQIARVQDHLEKVSWTDRFERRTLLNGWDFDEKTGPQVTIHDGIVSLAGTFTSNGRARLFQQRPAGAFVAFEARVTVHEETNARVGVFVSREMQRAGDAQVEAEVVVARHGEAGKNAVQVRMMKRGEEDLAYTDLPGYEWRPGQTIVLRIERTGESSDSEIRILVDGFPVSDPKKMPNLGKTTMPLRIGVFAEGQVGKKVAVDVDDVEIVYREKK